MHECGICFESYHPTTRVVRFLPCGHDYCESCLLTLHEDGLIICPDCRAEHRVRSVDDLTIVYNLMSAEHQQRHQDLPQEAGAQANLPQEAGAQANLPQEAGAQDMSASNIQVTVSRIL